MIAICMGRSQESEYRSQELEAVGIDLLDLPLSYAWGIVLLTPVSLPRRCSCTYDKITF